jgi:hypothetical protein
MNAELVAAPDKKRHLRRELEESSGLGKIVAQPLKTFDGLIDIWNHTVVPAAQFVTEDLDAVG